MTRLTLIVISVLWLSSCYRAQTPEKIAKDVAGEWRFSRALAAEDQEELPASLAELTLLLKPDGTFVARNAPEGFFFPNSALASQKSTGGNWRVSTQDGDVLLFLEFSVGGLWSNGIEIRNMKSAIKIVQRIGQRTAVFYLTKVVDA